MHYFTIVLGAGAAASLLLCVSGYLVRCALKTGAVKALPATRKKKLRQANTWLHKHHATFGKAALLLSALHAAACLFVVHVPSAMGLLLFALCLLLYWNGRAKRNASWLHVHRTLASVATLALVAHVILQAF